MERPQPGEKILFDDRFKIGRHGYVFRFNGNEWVRSTVTAQEFKDAKCEYENQLAAVEKLKEKKHED